MVTRLTYKGIINTIGNTPLVELQRLSPKESVRIFAKLEGDKQRRINTSKGRKREVINLSGWKMQKTVNETGRNAPEILVVAAAATESIEKIGAVVPEEGGV